MEFPENIPGCILDEIALEGLEGLTISTLWIRLTKRKNFPIALDDQSKRFIWKIICKNDAVEMFKLAVPRPLLIDYNRYDNLDPELEIICEPETLPEDIYPVAAVEDKVNGIRGSCATYNTRKNITPEAKTLSLEESVSKYGEQLVLVACQAARNVALAGVQTGVLETLAINSYIMLERIGRSREHGDVTQGRYGLSRLNIPPKSAFYFRKRLLADGLIVKQPISMRVSNRNVLGTLLHLSRFYSLRLPKLLYLIKRLIQILKDSPPHYMLDYPTIRTKLSTSLQLKKILAASEMRQYAVVESVPYRFYFPDATIKDWKMRNCDNEKQVKVVRLIDPSIDPEALFQGDEAPPDDGSLYSEGEEESSSSGILSNAVIQRHHHSIVQQAYAFVEASGSEGLTQGALAEQLGLSQLDARSTIRVLSRLMMVHCVVKEVKKNRVFLYVSKNHFGANAIRAQFEQEQQKIKGLMQVGNESVTDYNQTTTSTPSLASSTNVQLEKDVTLREEEVAEDDGLFRPNVPRGILAEGETISDLTHRSLRRVNIILEAIRQHLVIEEIGVLLRLVTAEEAKEGVDARMDRRSLKRLLARLSNEGQLKNMRIVLRCGDRERALNFICQPGVDQNNSVIRSAIDQAKMKLFCLSKHKYSRSTSAKPEKSQLKNEKLEFNDTSVQLDPSLCDSVKQVKEQLLKGQGQGTKSFPFKVVHATNSGRVYGTEPKCIRVKEIHTLLYYLVYGYDGELFSDQAQAREALRNENPILEGVDDEAFENLPDIYKTKLGWQTFIEPLPAHSGWPSGWSFLCDILLRLPLSIFLKVVNITYQIEGLETYLKHPIKQYVLLKHLPMDIRQGLIYARKYIFSVHEIITNMVYLGLAQFGPHSLKEKDQVFIYLNRKTTIMDTTTSNPGYHHITRDMEYEKKTFIFESMEDVEKYWYEVWTICSNTLLGSVSTVAGQSITLEMLRKKPAMIEAMRMREPHEAPLLDTGEVPGDHLGAAGFDSAFFAHLKRNWTYNKATTMINRLELQVKKTGTGGKADKSPQTKTSNLAAAPGRLASLRDNAIRFTQCTTQDGTNLTIPVTLVDNANPTRGQKRKRHDSKKSSPTVGWSKVGPKKTRVSTKPASKTRVVKPRKQKGPRRPYYDEKDRQALLLMRRLRVTWSAMEDSFLLMCKVAGTYIHGSLRHSVPFIVVRDCLHETYPESRNKTSRACQRRVAYMMRNPTTEYQVVNAYQELEQDPEIEAVSGGGPITKEDRKHGVEKTEELIVTRFRKLLEYLKPRYSQGGNSSAIPGLKLPDTIEEFHQQYELTYSLANLRHRRPILEVNNVVDVNCNVVYNVIHSSMCTTEDKTAWGFHLFNIYQQYPDNLVRSTLAKMKNDMMIAQRKRSLVRNKKFSEMPLSAVPYKLSITYIHLFLSRYQYPVFHRSYQRLRSIIAEKEKVPQDNQDWSGVEVSRIHEGGNAAMVVSLFAIGMARFRFTIPEQIIIFDPKLKDHPEEFDNLIKRYNNWVKDVDAAAQNASKEDRAQIQRRRLGMTSAAASNAVAAIPKLMSTTMIMDNEESNQAPTGTRGSSESVSTLSMDRTQNQLIMRTASRIGLHMLREDMTQDSQLPGQSAPHIQQEHFVINSCKVFVDVILPESEHEGWLFISPKKKQEIIDSIPTTVPFADTVSEQSFLDLYDQHKLSQSVKQDAIRVLQLITSKKEMGIVVSELPYIVGSLSDSSCTLDQHISFMVDSRVIQKVGVVAQRFVAIQHIDPWVIKSFRLLRSGKEKLEPFNSAHMVAKQNDDKSEPKAQTEEVKISVSEEISKEETSSMPAETKGNAGESQQQSQMEEEMETCQPGESRDEGTTSVIPAGTVSESANEVVPGRRKRTLPSFHHSSKKSRTVDSLGSNDRVDLLVMVKPWVKIDGGLNRRVLDRLLGGLLSHVLLKPGSNMGQLAERFHPALQPFQTRELLELLEKIGCVEFYGIRKTGKAGLFAARTTLEIVPLDRFARDQDIYVDPKSEAILRLGEFIGEKKYEKDYIPKCSCHNNVET
ncbi:general transcription factor 3C polypeptide 1 isoform X2 [Daphnia magna]|uniref:general transcription factor 3C polypeptide 1 isoform X2 n=1 Tax=Daphnia magna TaxID=35525 RepID=UPI001E1BD8BE|nr:general transcription factor 3C polypeptide 1 isoform X2 [Daphnia magna]